MGTSICVVQARLGKRDHPHAYGDKNTHENFSANANGSSPRVWGQVSDRHLIMCLPGIIPTRMGTRENSHPNPLFLSGSSPRVWGQEFITVRIGKLKRIIPTRMGTSALINDCFLLVEDHPHAYGDKALVRQSKITGTGSSPRVWGQVVEQDCFTALIRIIPTRMGTSPCQTQYLPSA